MQLFAPWIEHIFFHIFFHNKYKIDPTQEYSAIGMEWAQDYHGISREITLILNDIIIPKWKIDKWIESLFLERRVTRKYDVYNLGFSRWIDLLLYCHIWYKKGPAFFDRFFCRKAYILSQKIDSLTYIVFVESFYSRIIFLFSLQIW